MGEVDWLDGFRGDMEAFRDQFHADMAVACDCDIVDVRKHVKRERFDERFHENRVDFHKDFRNKKEEKENAIDEQGI